MKKLLILCVVSLLAGCAGMPGDIFGAPDEDIQNGLISGKPFVIQASGKSVTVIPVDPRNTMPCPSTGCANVKTNEIYIRQRPSVTAMMRDFRHELDVHIIKGERHTNDTTGPVRDERKELLERERAINCARLGIQCY